MLLKNNKFIAMAGRYGKQGPTHPTTEQKPTDPQRHLKPTHEKNILRQKLTEMFPTKKQTKYGITSNNLAKLRFNSVQNSLKSQIKSYTRKGYSGKKRRNLRTEVAGIIQKQRNLQTSYNAVLKEQAREKTPRVATKAETVVYMPSPVNPPPNPVKPGITVNPVYSQLKKPESADFYAAFGNVRSITDNRGQPKENTSKTPPQLPPRPQPPPPPLPPRPQTTTRQKENVAMMTVKRGEPKVNEPPKVNKPSVFNISKKTMQNATKEPEMMTVVRRTALPTSTPIGEQVIYTSTGKPTGPPVVPYVINQLYAKVNLTKKKKAANRKQQQQQENNNSDSDFEEIPPQRQRPTITVRGKNGK
jgi:hypothetical protein